MDFLDSFSEDKLPSGQPIIHTSNLVRFEKFLKMSSLLHQKEWKPTMGLITGVAGVGKTIAIAHYVTNYPQRPHTGLPGCIKARIRSRSTPKALAMDIASALGEQPRGRNVYELADEAAMAMLRNDVEMLLLDECDLLNDDSFEAELHRADEEIRTTAQSAIQQTGPVEPLISSTEDAPVNENSSTEKGKQPTPGLLDLL